MRGSLISAVVGLMLGIGPWWAISLAAAEYERGKALYDDKCQLCHGLKGDGKGPAAASFTPKPSNFTSPKFWGEKNEKGIAETIRKGHGPMPAFDLKPDEIQAIIDYMSHTFGKANDKS